MFEHYSVADLFANLYKKRKANILALIALFALIAVPFTIKAVKNKKHCQRHNKLFYLYQL